MNDLWKKTAILAVIGFALGVLVSLGFLLHLGMEAVYEQQGGRWIMVYMLLSGGLGMASMGSMTIYEIEHWSLTRATLTHLAITLAAFCALGGWLGWFDDLRRPWVWITFALYLGAYFIIWLIMYQSYKHKVRRINEELKHWKDAQGGE